MNCVLRKLICKRGEQMRRNQIIVFSVLISTIITVTLTSTVIFANDNTPNKERPFTKVSGNVSFYGNYDYQSQSVTETSPFYNGANMVSGKPVLPNTGSRSTNGVRTEISTVLGVTTFLVATRKYIIDHILRIKNIFMQYIK